MSYLSKIRLKTKWGHCIYVSPSGYKVYQNFFYRWLTLGSSALQTVINRRNPNHPVLYYIPVLSLMAQQYPGAACLLGLGGASVPRLLTSENPEQSIVVVENSQEVIRIAKQFFMLDNIPNLILFHQNAEEYIKECTKQYKHLIIDLYNANSFPEECNNEAFFINARNRVAADGFLAINLANYKEQWPIFQWIKKYFKNTLVIPVKKSANVVIIASTQESHESFMNQLQTCHRFKKIFWIDSWGFVGKF